MFDLFFKLIKKRLRTPRDTLTYIIPVKAIKDTEKILLEYGDIDPPNEGLVYWAGVQRGNKIIVSLVFAPLAESNEGRLSTSNRSNFDFVRALNRLNVMQIAQVHSHPGKWVDHSRGDDVLAAFKKEGLISIVVPEYCQGGVLPLSQCGIHRYTKGFFLRLSQKYIEKHFTVAENFNSLLEDFRNDYSPPRKTRLV
jgi:hypothetical protein